MEPYNITFTVFVIDARPFEQLKQVLDESLGGQLLEDLEYRAEGKLRYTSDVFGLDISCLYEDRWTEGSVYRLVGSNRADCWFDTPATIDMAFHVARLLDASGLTRVMTFDEFRKESEQRRKLASDDL